jgi:hypothetical protein
MQEIDLSTLPKKERKKLKREMERHAEESKKKTGTIMKWGIIGFILLLVALASVFMYRELSKPLPGQQMPDQGRAHVSREEWEKYEYNSNPPTSGSHDSDWKRAGVYNQPEGDGYLVHSLEHGYIVMSHNCKEDDKDCLAFVDKLKERVTKDSYKLILVPRPNLDTNFALTAWTRLDTFNLADASTQRVEQFIKAFRNQGPEKTME